MASRLQDVVLRGTRVSQPPATTVASGTLFYVTDESVTERASDSSTGLGVTWEDYSDTGGGGITELTGDVVAGPGSGSQVATVSIDIKTKAIGIIILSSDGVTPITSGILGDIYIPFACVITEVTLIADLSCTAVFDIWAATFPTIPTIADTIVAAAFPTLTASVTSQDTTLTGWTVAIPVGTILRFNLNSNDNATRINLTLTVTT